MSTSGMHRRPFEGRHLVTFVLALFVWWLTISGHVSGHVQWHVIQRAVTEGTFFTAPY